MSWWMWGAAWLVASVVVALVLGRLMRGSGQDGGQTRDRGGGAGPRASSRDRSAAIPGGGRRGNGFDEADRPETGRDIA